MVNVTHELRYKFIISSRELKLIRKALIAFENAEGLKLADNITNQIRTSTEDLRKHFETLLNIEIKE